jgi:hypothetical protein
MDPPRWSPEDRVLLDLCSGKSVSCFRRPPDWNRLLQTARQHRVAALALDRLLRLPLAASEKAALCGAVRKEIVSVLHDNTLFKAELHRLAACLRERGIDFILLKGLSLNYSGLRNMGDIDLLVLPERIVEAIEAILTIDGYRYRRMLKEGPDPRTSFEHRLSARERRKVRAHLAWNNEFQVHNPAIGVLIELHHTPFQIRNPDGRFLENLEGMKKNTWRFWEEKRFAPELSCHVPSPGHSLLLLCLRNSIKQRPSGNAFRLSNLVDVDNLAAGDIGWKDFVRDCSLFEVSPHALFSLELARRLLGTAVPPPVLRGLKARCTPKQLRAVRVHLRCVKSLRSCSILFSKLYETIRPGAFGGTFGERLRGLLLLSIWLPSRFRMAHFYGLSRDSPWMGLAYALNPARWVRRIIEKAFT